MRPSATALITLLCLASPGLASLSSNQDNVRVLGGDAVETKYLTPNGTDTWKIEVATGETLRVHVSTREFDPVLELIAPDDTRLLEYDDEGSECRFAQCVEQDGEYRILVRGFEHRGGGNYQLSVQVLPTTSIEVGAETLVRLDRLGGAYRRFQAQPDQVVVPVLQGTVSKLALLDPRGGPIGDWLGSFRITRAGAHVLALHGKPGATLRVTVALARRQALEDGGTHADELQPGQMHVYELDRGPLDFRLIELSRREGIVTRLLRASEPDAKMLEPRGFDLRHLPVMSKGMHQRYASVFGRDDRYELQVLSMAREPRAYTLALTDPSVPIAVDAPLSGVLAVGASDFFRYDATPGELLRLDLRSAAFDTFLRLYDSEGIELASNDDAGDGLDSRIGLLVQAGGSYLLQVTARGDGGGGAYTLAVEQREVSRIAAGEAQSALIGPDGTRYWHFDGRAGQTLLVSVRSTTCDPSVEVLGPDGVILGQDQDGGLERDCLLPLKLARTGLHTLWVRARGGGECELRLIALD